MASNNKTSPKDGLQRYRAPRLDDAAKRAIEEREAKEATAAQVRKMEEAEKKAIQ